MYVEENDGDDGDDDENDDDDDDADDENYDSESDDDGDSDCDSYVDNVERDIDVILLDVGNTDDIKWTAVQQCTDTGPFW